MSRGVRVGLLLAALVAGGMAGGQARELAHVGRSVAGTVALLTSSLKSVNFTAARVDWVEREIRGGPAPLFTTFATVYQINGRPASPAAFWRAVKPGRVIQAKTARRAGILWAARINVKVPR